MKATLPDNEFLRLEALHHYKILDTEAERSFDDLVRLAAEICDTPISLMSLVDADRQWFKARNGLQVAQTPRDIAFCAHAILQKDLMIVTDALSDARFVDNILVREEPKIRFYAGAPLVTPEGLPLGTLCVIDREPRRLTDFQVEALRTLGRAVVSQLELRRKLGEIAALTAERERLLMRLCVDCARWADVPFV